MGGETVLSLGVLRSDVGYSGSDEAKTAVCGRVLEQLGEVWPDVAAMVLVGWLDDAFSRCTSKSKGAVDVMDDSDSSSSQPEGGKWWCLGARSILPQASVVAAVESCIRRHCEAMYDMHLNAFVQVRRDDALDSAVARLRCAVIDVIGRGTSSLEVESSPVVKDFLAAFLPMSLPVDDKGLARIRQCMRAWVGTKPETPGKFNGQPSEPSNDLSGWGLVDADDWRPCAIGMVPSRHLTNGALPYLSCFSARDDHFDDDPDGTDVIHMHAVVDGAAATETEYQTGVPSEDSENDGNGIGDDDEAVTDDPEENAGGHGLLPPPPDFHL